MPTPRGFPSARTPGGRLRLREQGTDGRKKGRPRGYGDCFRNRVNSTLSDEDFNQMGIRFAIGTSPDEAFATDTDQGRTEADFEDLAARIAEGENRQLTRTELERLAALDEQAALQGETDIDAREALYDLDSSDGRERYIAERMNAPQERTEPSANVLDDDGEERPGYNLDRSDERAAAIDARLAGEVTSTYDDTYETTTEGD